MRRWAALTGYAGGERAAAIYSLIGSAKLNGIDQQSYLHHGFKRIADYPVNRVGKLLPWNIAAHMTSDTPALLAA